MYAGGPESKVSRRNLLVAGMSMAVLSAASMVQGCGSESVTQITPTSGAPAPPDQGNGNVVGPIPPAFVQPQVLRAVNGVLDTTLATTLATNTVGGSPVTLRSYNGQLTGPTLRLKQGERLRVLLRNDLGADVDPVPPANPDTPHQLNTTNLHTHGLHVSPQGNSDNIFVEIHPGDSFQYQYDIPTSQPPGTLWYHPHKHGSSNVQLISGMAGALIIEGGLDEVPAIKAARDLVYLITELNVDATGQVPVWNASNLNPFALPNRRLLVNGQLVPTLSAFSGEVIRLRVINGTARAAIPFSIAGHTLNIISLDGIALPSMREVSSVLLPPAGRCDVLVRCGAPGNYDVQKLLDTSVTNNDALVNIGVLNVLNTVVTMELPDKLPAPPYQNITAAELTDPVKQFTFAQANNSPPPFPNFTVNGVLFDPNRVDVTIPLNSVQEWELINTTTNGHPFHIHVNDFMVLSVNNVPLPEPEWHDTFNIPKNGRIRIRHRFEDFKGMFVFHCHILVHEDLGMMQVVNIT